MYTLWPEASYCSQVAKKHSETVQYTQTNRDTIQKILDNKSIGIVPTHNKYGGTVTQTLEHLYMHRDKLKIISWDALPIMHVVATKHDDMPRVVYSHPQAIKQCQKRVSEYGLDAQETTSTTSHIDKLQPGEWVICSKEAAQKYGLAISDLDICPSDNMTHFAIVAHRDLDIQKDISNQVFTFGVIQTGDESGALLQVLQILAKHHISLQFIVSEASGPDRYDFPILIKGDVRDKYEFLQELEEMGTKLILL